MVAMKQYLDRRARIYQGNVRHEGNRTVEQLCVTGAVRRSDKFHISGLNISGR